jgi:hypothetical protein
MLCDCLLNHLPKFFPRSLAKSPQDNRPRRRTSGSDDYDHIIKKYKARK